MTLFGETPAKSLSPRGLVVDDCGVIYVCDLVLCSNILKCYIASYSYHSHVN